MRGTNELYGVIEKGKVKNAMASVELERLEIVTKRMSTGR
jgi:hypothetical protein